MTRALFLTRLRQGLKGLAPDEIDEIVTDYEAHFSDAGAAGRGENDVAASLGDPLQLGRELAAESKLRRWERRRNPGNFLRAGFALVGLETFSGPVLLPVLAGLALCAGIAGYVVYVAAATGLHLLSGLLSGNGNILIPVLVGLGLVCGVVGAGALIALLLDSGLRLLGRYMRLSYRLLKPGDKDEE
jgi:uncharacterized membrane protein